MHLVASIRVCVCVCHVRALTFKSFDLETSFWYAGKSLEYLGQVRISRSPDQGSDHRSKRGRMSKNQIHTSVMVSL